MQEKKLWQLEWWVKKPAQFYCRLPPDPRGGPSDHHCLSFLPFWWSSSSLPIIIFITFLIIIIILFIFIFIFVFIVIIIVILPGPPACRHLTKVLLCCSWHAPSWSFNDNIKRIKIIMIIIITIITSWQSSRCRDRAVLRQPVQCPQGRTYKGPLSKKKKYGLQKCKKN